DEDYENKGNDYPLPYVRWTEKRNFETILNAIERKALDVIPLITEKVELKDYQNIYGDMRKHGAIASLISYSESSINNTVVKLTDNPFQGVNNGIGIIGAGNFTGATVIPAFKDLKANIKYVVSAGGLTATSIGKRSGAVNATSDYREVLKDKDVDLVLITTRHNLHAEMVIEALRANKNVFVEKPLCLKEQELELIIEAQKESGKNVMVGFNRRFAPLAEKLKSLIGNAPMNIVATVNAGFISPEVWVHDMEVGGGRIIGEACHFIDLCSYLAGSRVLEVCMNAMGTIPQENTDNASILLHYENGTNAVINYFSNGSKAYSKERIEVYSQGKTFVLDNWRQLKAYGVSGFTRQKGKQDKGHRNQFRLLVNRTNEGGNVLIPFDSIVNTSKASFGALSSMREGGWIKI
ncbi:MAG: Gfo/Idh/MocA family oxidoreductase, partial [Lentisphaerales bacterium]|nr:Gfo/Idh/MocA family oxidoreductase [Lentisphaerales bacterium]